MPLFLIRIIVLVFFLLLPGQAVCSEDSAFPSSPTWVEQTSGMEFVRIEGGCFMMGDTLQQGDADELPVSEICLDSFYIAKFETTQKHWEAVMGYNPSYVKQGEDYPVEWVSWDDAVEFTIKLSSLSGKQFRLPTEAEWEYAARGKEEVLFAGGNDIDQLAWYNSNSELKSHPVGSKKPNSFGLFDMSGNVWEWCYDWYSPDYYANRPNKNPTGAIEGSAKVSRGGGFVDVPRYIRAANRGGYAPTNRSNVLGFRVVLQINN